MVENRSKTEPHCLRPTKKRSSIVEPSYMGATVIPSNPLVSKGTMNQKVVFVSVDQRIIIKFLDKDEI